MQENSEIPEKFHHLNSESLEALDKKEARDKGRQEADFYRALLDKLRRFVLKGLGEISVQDAQTKTLQELGIGSQYLIDLMTTASKDITSQGKRTNSSIKFDPEALIKMTPQAFDKYIEELKGSLIK